MSSDTTRFPHIEKPWLQYYTPEEINAPLPECTMQQFMYQQTEDRLDETALIYFDRKITHRTLRQNVLKYARNLTAHGVKSGDYVSLCLLALPETIYFIYALNMIGATINFVSLVGTEDDFARQISCCNSSLIITFDLMLEKVVKAATIAGGGKTIVSIPLGNSARLPLRLLLSMKTRKLASRFINHSTVLSLADFLTAPKDAPVAENTNSGNPALLVYTGGTTGVSKGCCISNAAGNAQAMNYLNSSRLWNMVPGERFLSIMPPFIAYGFFMGIHNTLCRKCEIVLCPDPSVQKFPDKILKYHPNHFAGSPLHIEKLMLDSRFSDADLRYLHTVASGGDSLVLEWVEKTNAFLKAHNAPYPMINGYGMTEVCGGFATESHLLPLNIPFAKNTVRIKDPDTGKDLPYDTEGEICFAGPTLMTEYFNNPQATAELFFMEDGVRWLRTGDLGYVTPEGSVVISGRLKRLYVAVGPDNLIYKVFPAKTEKVLNSVPGIHKCFVVPREHPVHGNDGIAFIELAAGADPDATVAQARSRCQEQLPALAVPVEYRILDRLPTTASGKIDQKILEQQASQS